MGVNKGTDNFAKSRTKAITDNLTLIKHELEKQRKRRIPYPDLRSLVADISEKTALHRTTLTRKGSKYLPTLLSHLARQPGASALVNDKDATPEVLREKLYDARLENRTLNDRLAAREKRISIQNKETQQPGAGDSSKQAAPNWYLAFADTAMLLNLVIARMNSIDETLRVDVDARQLLDLSAPMSERLVAGPERAKWFVDYYRKLNEQETGSGGGGQ
jgi:hypothetical protein